MEKIIRWGTLGTFETTALARDPGKFEKLISAMSLREFKGETIDIEDGDSAILACVDKDHLISSIKDCEKDIFTKNRGNPHVTLYSDFRDFRPLRATSISAGFKAIRRGFTEGLGSNDGFKQWVTAVYESEKEAASVIKNGCSYLHVKMSSAHTTITPSVMTRSGKPADIYLALIAKYGSSYLRLRR